METAEALFDKATLVDHYQQVSHYVCPEGYIIWRRGTGNNVELLNIYTIDHRKGYGTMLMREMLKQLKSDPPQEDSIFGFTRMSNPDAIHFYDALGFSLSEVDGLYEEGIAVFFSTSFNKLSEKLNA